MSKLLLAVVGRKLSNVFAKLDACGAALPTGVVSAARGGRALGHSLL